jgi:nucleoside-diphosphate-sugar epimerase
MTEPTSGGCAITGASGYLGGRLAAELAGRGWTVHRLVRPRPGGAAGTVPYTLPGGAPEGFFERDDVTALVHCAYDFGQTKWDDIHEVNVRGSIKLLEAAHKAGIERMVYISTISAFDGCRSMYGKAKMEIEHAALDLGASVVRPGLIYGDHPGAMVESLTKAVAKLPVVPLIGSGRQVQYLVHDQDLAEFVALLLDGRKPVDRPIVAADGTPYTFRDVLGLLAAANGRGRPRFLPIPWRLVWGLLKTAEAAGLKPGFRSDSVVSLIHQDPAPDFEPARAAGAVFRPYPGAPER